MSVPELRVQQAVTVCLRLVHEVAVLRARVLLPADGEAPPTMVSLEPHGPLLIERPEGTVEVPHHELPHGSEPDVPMPATPELGPYPPFELGDDGLVTGMIGALEGFAAAMQRMAVAIGRAGERAPRVFSGRWMLAQLFSFEASFVLFLYSNEIKVLLPTLPIDETVLFGPLGRLDLLEIARRQVAALGERLRHLHQIDLTMGDDGLGLLADRALAAGDGAHGVERAITRLLSEPLGRDLLAGRIQRGAQVNAGTGAGDDLRLTVGR